MNLISLSKMEGKMLFDLEPGDRFYFTGDKRRTVFEVFRKVQKSPIKNIISFVETTDRIERHRNCPVVFLRNINGESKKVLPDVKQKYGTAPQRESDKITGEQLRDEGIKLAVDHADHVIEKWSDRAFGFLKDFIKLHDVFMAEDIRESSLRIIPEPPSDRAWGGVIVRAVKEGLITRKGYSNVKNANAHCTPATVWQTKNKI